MATVFLVCAILGGVILLCQFVLTLAGFETHHDIMLDHHVDIGGHHGGDTHAEQGSAWFLHVLSLRSLVAALTFFGLAGLAASASPVAAPFALPIGLVAGAMAMVIIAWLMGMLHTLQSEGTVQIERTVGAMGIVYLTIPGQGAGSGKVTIKVQNRTMEYAAVTEEPTSIQTGMPIMVVGVAAPDMVQVASAPQ